MKRKIQNDTKEVILNHMNKILIRTRKIFIEQYADKWGSVSWIQRKYTLTDNIVLSHIEGKRTVGIYYFGNATVFLFFDIDAEGDIQGQKSRVEKIIVELKKYGVSEEDIHVMFSGCKGYHIQLFFDNSIPIKRVSDFGRQVLRNLGDLAEGIELRPENINGRGIKLPLAYHKKAKKFACYVKKETLEPVGDSLKYFLEITPFKSEVMENACEMALSRGIEQNEKKSKDIASINESIVTKSFTEMKLSFNDTYNLEKKAKELLRKGLKRKGLRHEAQFILALYYKGQGIQCKKAIQEIFDWVQEQWKNKKTNESNLELLTKEVERHVKYVYKNKNYKRLFSKRGRELIITPQDLSFIASQKKKNVRKVLLSLLLIGRIYNENGIFSADMDSIGKISNLSRQTVSVMLKELINQGVIEQVSEYVYTEGLARTYHMLYLKEENQESQKISGFLDLNLSEIFQNLIQLVEENVKSF
ncbi:hypothetical protein BK749_01610 [Bacillus thuringiensis serovar vazensis]|uniref:TOTE conflict system primase domain-containing protein n=1 Tax=Bacillus thuringiensis serovar vazensis TaxID=180867 RepID=A0A243D1Y3_BACTU|nr:hypothetical protein [Bacillus thuringiensis]OTY80060.1 hypothetical protein BK749_01610 [Bacillus thuringiensis serovar vazensis]